MLFLTKMTKINLKSIYFEKFKKITKFDEPLRLPFLQKIYSKRIVNVSTAGICSFFSVDEFNSLNLIANCQINSTCTLCIIMFPFSSKIKFCLNENKTKFDFIFNAKIINILYLNNIIH